MGWYSDQVVPRVLAAMMRGREYQQLRARTLADLHGEVLEIGFGAGLNVPFYPGQVTRVQAVEPAAVGRKLAAGRLAASAVPVEFAGTDAQDLPADDQSVDSVLSTWTLCSIPGSGQRPRGDPPGPAARRRPVLHRARPVPRSESGPAAAPPHPAAASCRRRLPSRPARRPAGDRAGLELTQLQTFYASGPRAQAYTFEGIATRR